jgi:co-chaperonin GroES (HSP10)
MNAKKSLMSNKNHYHVNPLGMRVVVRIPKLENQTNSGLYLPPGAKENMYESILVDVEEVASAHDSTTNEDSNISGIPLGAKVLIKKDSGIRIPWDESLRIVDTKEVLAVVESVSLS